MYRLLITTPIQIQNISIFSDSCLNVFFFSVSLFLLPPLPVPYIRQMLIWFISLLISFGCLLFPINGIIQYVFFFVSYFFHFA